MGKRNVKAILCVVLLVIVDQFSKYLIRQSGGFYICNKGVAFGIHIPEIFFWAIWIIIFGFIIIYFFKFDNKTKNNKNYWLLVTGYWLLISGALSNMIDRIHLGCVIDFIDIRIFNYPLFNLADTFIVIGAILVILESAKQKTRSEK